MKSTLTRSRPSAVSIFIIIIIIIITFASLIVVRSIRLAVHHSPTTLHYDNVSLSKSNMCSFVKAIRDFLKQIFLRNSNKG